MGADFSQPPFFYSIETTYLTLAILIISENTPAAVTLAPAPYPFMIIGYSLYLSVVICMILLLPSSS